MSPRPGHRGILAAALLGAGVAGSALAGDHVEFVENAADASVRRTNSCNCGTVGPSQVLPDVERIVISPWQAFSPQSDRFTGSAVSRTGAHLVRIDTVFLGLVNPPGPLGMSGDYAPFLFGPSPMYGFVEIDVDGDKDTGGDSASSAALHFLANAARFGGRPAGSFGDRAATGAGDMYQPWNQSPRIRLSGADWILSFCGCFTPTIVYQSNAESTFVEGATWVIEGRFFSRSDGYQGASTMTGGTAFGQYDPIVQVQFQHSIASNKTTVSLVYALDPIGAGQLIGQGPQPIGSTVTNHTSIAEGVTDLISYSHGPGLIPGSFEYQIESRWAGKSVANATDVTRWRPTFIIGTADAIQSDGLYVWTDAGFSCRQGDMNGDGAADALDRAEVQEFIDEHDGGSDDADGVVNGRVTLGGFGANYSVFDVDGDGVVGPLDLAFYSASCTADFNHSGSLTPQDIFDFLGAWFGGQSEADFNRSGGLSVQDIFDFLAAWFAGC
jgi:hypothetical protein